MKLYKRSLASCRNALMLVMGILCISSLSLQAQDLPITGKVSAANGTPLPGVTVQVAGTAHGTATTTDGSFKLNAASGSTLKFTFVGYLPKEIKVNNATPLNVTLEEDVQKLNDVVVVGYGTQKKATLTGAVTTVNMVDKDGQPLTNVSNALAGTPGIFANLGNSQPGVDRSTIRIRGIGTLNNANPLILVDGIEYSMDELNPN